MGTRKFFTQLDFANRCLMKEVLHGDMFRFVDSFRVFVSKFLLFVFESIITYIFSFRADTCFGKDQYCNCNHQINDNCCRDSKIDEFSQEENGFQVHNKELVNESDEVKENSVVMETNKYEFLSGKHVSGFVEEPKTLIFSVQEFYMGASSDFTRGILDTEEVFHQKKPEDSVENVLKKQEETLTGSTDGILDAEQVFHHEKAEESLENVLRRQEETFTDSTEGILDIEEVFHQEKAEDSVENFWKKREKTFTDNEETVFAEYKFIHNYNTWSEVPYLFPFHSELDTTNSSDVSEDLATESLEAIPEEKIENIERMLDQATFVVENQTLDSDDDDEYIEFKPDSQNSSVFDEDMYSIRDLMEPNNKDDEEDLVYEATDLVHGSVEFEESSFEQKKSFSEYDDEDDDEFSLEHEEIIEQLKMELRNARTGGLSTIMEESESPKMVEELKPFNVDKKFEHKDRIIEIHKFYRSYLNKMRKLDVLNSQTMHAIGLLELKHPGQLIKTQKSAVPVIKFLLSQNLWAHKPRRPEANSTFKFIGELHKDFELVYVGQLCLSWEILHWQYMKAFELQECDCQQLRQYNQVADEFQIFQVLLQRFIENEPFQSLSRVQNYVKHRRAHCNLLQVPVIKDDNLKGKMRKRRDGEDAITSAMLIETIEESMRLFWEFLRADKDEADMIIKGPELQDSVDSEFLIDIRTEFQKKEKRIKEILRSSGCIVKKLQKNPEGRLSSAMFFAQVELKLVSRVLNMSKLTTDQLVWCHEKLAKINFWNRKLALEPSFLLFPC